MQNNFNISIFALKNAFPGSGGAGTDYKNPLRGLRTKIFANEAYIRG